MRKERKEIGLGFILLNEGQLPWLPKNPRQWTQTDIDKTAASIKEDPDFLEDRPLLVVPFDDKNYIVFAGNLRHEGSLAAKRSKVPCVVYYPETDEDQETIKRRAMKDNGSFGQFDWDEVFSSEWGTMPLQDWGIGKKWDNEAQRQMADGGLSSEGREGDEEYNQFLDKFEQKLTTDDCYTPPKVYDEILKFVGELTPLKGRKVIRPFYPGGNYEDLAQYQKNCIVVDNPPFSILSKIIRFYCAHKIDFYLFAPGLTLFSATDCDLTYIVADCTIEYENGAVVRTGFITNIIPDVRIWVCPELGERVEIAQEKEDKTKRGFVYPDNIVTSAILQKIADHGVSLKIRKVSCEPIKHSDSAQEQGRDLYGRGFIMSDGAAAERAAAERAAATRLNLSEREKAIIARLNEQDGTNNTEQ